MTRLLLAALTFLALTLAIPSAQAAGMSPESLSARVHLLVPGAVADHVHLQWTAGIEYEEEEESRVRPGHLIAGIPMTIIGSVLTGMGAAALVGAAVLADEGGFSGVGAVILLVLGVPVASVGLTLLTVGVILLATARKKPDAWAVRPLEWTPLSRGVAPPSGGAHGIEVLWRW